MLSFPRCMNIFEPHECICIWIMRAVWSGLIHWSGRQNHIFLIHIIRSHASTRTLVTHRWHYIQNLEEIHVGVNEQWEFEVHSWKKKKKWCGQVTWKIQYCAWSGRRSTSLLGQMCFVHSALIYVSFCVADNLTYMLTDYMLNSLSIKSKFRVTGG